MSEQQSNTDATYITHSELAGIIEEVCEPPCHANSVAVILMKRIAEKLRAKEEPDVEPSVEPPKIYETQVMAFPAGLITNETVYKVAEQNGYSYVSLGSVVYSTNGEWMCYRSDLIPSKRAHLVDGGNLEPQRIIEDE